MTPARTVEDLLREEYFDLLPDMRKVLHHLEAEIRYRLLPVSRTLSRFERLDVTSRLKECESAVESLRRRQQGALFYPDPETPYTLTTLKDLVGVRVSVFPGSRLNEVNRALSQTELLRGWEADPLLIGNKTLALKFSGYCQESSSQVRGEYQIISSLTGLFWNVEHAAIYKPSPGLRDVASSLLMQERSKAVLDALGAFEEEFERLVRESKS